MSEARILSDDRWCGAHGIGRFAAELRQRLPAMRSLHVPWPLLHPLEPLLLTGVAYALRPQVYFSPGFNPPLRSPGACVFTIHDLIHLHVPAETSRAKQVYYRLVVRPAARRAFRVLTVSRYTQQALQAWTGLSSAQIQVVGNGVGAAFTPHGVVHQPGYPYLLYVGNRKPHKNVPRLLHAWGVSGLWRTCALVLTGPPDATIQQQVRALQVPGRVVYAGHLSDAALAAYYRGALALVCPSLYEGFGLPVLEAMACGTPVLASNVTAIPEVAGDAAVLVDPLDVEALAWGLRCIVDDGTLRQQLRQRGLQRAAHWTWDAVAVRVGQVLQAAAQA